MSGQALTHAALLHIESDGSIYCHVNGGAARLPEDLSLGDLFRALALASEVDK